MDFEDMVTCKNNNLILMGFMGVGKGSLARELSRLTNRMAIDTDDLIESMENTKIKKIFEKEGEAYFRQAEKKVSLWLESGVQNCIISIGGGFFEVGNLQNIGHVIYLESSFDAILDRINASKNPQKKLKKRPLLQDMAKANTLINERHPKYLASSDTVIQTEGKSSLAIAEEIIQALDELEQQKGVKFEPTDIEGGRVLLARLTTLLNQLVESDDVDDQVPVLEILEIEYMRPDAVENLVADGRLSGVIKKNSNCV